MATVGYFIGAITLLVVSHIFAFGGNSGTDEVGGRRIIAGLIVGGCALYLAYCAGRAT